MRKYYLDTDLQYKRIKLAFSKKLIRIFLMFLISLVLGAGYNAIYYHFKGSKKEEILKETITERQFKFVLLNKEFNATKEQITNLQASDELYRNILDLGFFEYSEFNILSEEYEYFENFPQYEIIIPAYKRLDTIQYLIQTEEASFYELEKETQSWLRKIAHLPYITPVNISIRRGDGIKFRERHPILGRPAWHHGQDFSAPMGTPVYATGAGKIIYQGYDRGYGNFIKIDHGYGYQTIYGHLSKFKTKLGQEVKRGDLIALSGSTGYSTGPHLHYEIHFYGQYQNPLYFFEDDLSEDEYIEMINLLNTKFR